MLPILNIGPLAVPAPELILLLGFWIGLELTEKHAEGFGADPKHLYNMALTAILAGLIGARLVYAARSPQAFLDSPWSLLAPRPEMLDGTGGLVAAALAAFIYGWVRRLRLWPTLDAATTLFAVLAVALGLSHFASGDAFGAPADIPWAISLWGAQRHPSQVYETIAALLVAAAVWPGSRAARYSRAQPGFRWWIFLAISAAARLALESFRGDSVLLMNSFRLAQVIAWLVLAVSLWQIGRRLGGPKAAEDTAAPDEQAAG